MVRVYLKGSYTIVGELKFDPDGPDNYIFNVPLEDKNPVTVEIIPGEGNVELFHEVEVSENMWGILQSDIYDRGKLSENSKEELTAMISGISEASEKVMSLIKYCFGQVKLKENLRSGDISWSKDGSEWKEVPTFLKATFYMSKFIYLDGKSGDSIQAFIDDDFKPFIALKYLHKAINEDNPSYMWIDATIAAELAIKEFLIRKEPTIESLILEVPSPPLDKLYGKILEFYAGEKSPKVKELKEGAETRNRLIHKPKEEYMEKK